MDHNTPERPSQANWRDSRLLWFLICVLIVLAGCRHRLLNDWKAPPCVGPGCFPPSQ